MREAARPTAGPPRTTRPPERALGRPRPSWGRGGAARPRRRFRRARVRPSWGCGTDRPPGTSAGTGGCPPGVRPWPACRPGDRTGCSWPPLRHVDCPPCLGGPVLLARGGGSGGTRYPRGHASSRPGCVLGRASGQGRGFPGAPPGWCAPRACFWGTGPGGTRHPRGQAGSQPGRASGQGRGLPGRALLAPRPSRRALGRLSRAMPTESWPGGASPGAHGPVAEAVNMLRAWGRIPRTGSGCGSLVG